MVGTYGPTSELFDKAAGADYSGKVVPYEHGALIHVRNTASSTEIENCVEAITQATGYQPTGAWRSGKHLHDPDRMTLYVDRRNAPKVYVPKPAA